MSHTLNLGGAQLAYTKTGAGPALVIIHGVGGHKEDWAGIADSLAPTRTVYAIDMLGFGGSSRDAAELGMPAQAAAIAALLDAEGHASADILGNSVGAWAAATFAAASPPSVRKLILANAAGFRAMFDGPPPVNFFPDTLDEMRALLATVFHAPFAHTEDFAKGALAALEASGERGIVPRLFAGLVASPKLEEVLPRITAPTLVLWGQEDRLFPAALAPYLAGLIPGARVSLIPDAGHFPQVDNPEAFLADVTAFLA